MRTIVAIKRKLAETLGDPVDLEYQLDEVIDSARAAGRAELVETEFTESLRGYVLRIYSDQLTAWEAAGLGALANDWYVLAVNVAMDGDAPIVPPGIARS